MRISVLALYICLFAATGCSHSRFSQHETPIQLKTAQTFILTGTKGYKEKQKFYYSSHHKTYEGKQLAHEREEVTEFTVENEIINVSNDPKFIEVKQKTLEKAGPADLNQMAFPELNETIVFRYNEWGDVLKAGNFPDFSIYYVSPLPLPRKPIQVGDTWSYKGTWIDSSQGLEMNIDLVGVFKQALSCFDGEICLELEYSGNIQLPEKLQEAIQYDGKVDARFVLRPKNFSILRSEVRNTESLAREESTMDIRSCIVSEVVRSQANTTLTCKP